MFPFLQISRGSEFVVLRSQVIRHSYVGRHLRCHKRLLALMDTHRVSSHVGDDFFAHWSFYDGPDPTHGTALVSGIVLRVCLTTKPGSWTDFLRWTMPRLRKQVVKVGSSRIVSTSNSGHGKSRQV